MNSKKIIDIIDLVHEPPFDSTEWIGKNRQWPAKPEDVPLGLFNHCKKMFDVPEELNNTITPPPNISIERLLETKSPSISLALLTINANKWFSDLPANMNEECLKSRALPPSHLIPQLQACIYQAILDGKISIEDPSYPGSRLPLWCISYWHKILAFSQIHQKCKDSISWLHSRKRNALVEKATVRVLSLPWAEPVDIGGAGTSTKTFRLTDLLSQRLLNDELVDMMFSSLSERIDANPSLEDAFIIETLRFSNELKKAKKAEDFKTAIFSPFLKRLESRIGNSKTMSLLFPIYLEEEKHWLAMKIDFESSTISYGDPLGHRGMKPPRSMIMQAQWWLENRFKSHFADKGNTLAHGRQFDGTECGVIAANTVAHNVFGDKRWSTNEKDNERLKWFLVLTEAYSKNNERTGVVHPPKPHTHTIYIRPLPPLPSIALAGTTDVVTSHLAPHKPTSIQSLLNPCPPTSEASDSALLIHDYSPEASKDPLSEHPVKKRRIEDAASDECEEDCGSDDQSTHRPMVGKSPPIRILGQSRSAQWHQAQKNKSNFANETERLRTFGIRLAEYDPKFEIISPTEVRHALCGKSITMWAPFNTANYKKHVPRCKKRKNKHPGAGMFTLQSIFTSVRENASSSSTPSFKLPPPNTLPCPGLTEKSYPLITNYLERTGALGGGGSSVTSIAHDIYNRNFSKLSTQRKHTVKQAQRNEWLWRNYHDSGTIQSTSCGGRAAVTDDGFASPCASCLGVLQHKRFKNAIRVPKPADKNYKFINHAWRNQGLALIYAQCHELRPILEDQETKNSPMIRYVKGVLSGRHRGDDLFGCLLQGIVLKRDKEDRGVGMQNFHHQHALVEFSHIVLAHSPAAYRALSEFLPLPNPRNLKLHASRLPHFSFGISDKTFTNALEYLRVLDYAGPVVLSCDDTKLLPALRPYYDANQKSFCIVGHTDDAPYVIADVESFQNVIETGQLEKATKLRLWCLQIPIPKVSTLILAARCIKDSTSANELFPYLWDLVKGLTDRRIHVAGYSADGSNVERNIQDMLEAKATTRQQTRIPHPAGTNGGDIVIDLGFIGPYPFTPIQDTKHLLKTCRNNAITGTHTLTFPNDVLLFSQIWDMALSGTSPLYRRDVDKLDRQDDNAATRFFCADTLKWINDHHREWRGLFIYLFIFGELVDAYQSRVISIRERVVMVLRAHFFLEIWEKFLHLNGYAKAQHFLSSQCRQICSIAIHGLLKLVIIYRDHLNEPMPLFPWMYSTEVIEHIFGICRQFVKDFTAENFQRMVPKVHIQLRQALLSSQIENGRARASGYSHTYADMRGIDIKALLCFPSDGDISLLALQAFEEAESLFALLGVSASDVYELSPGQLPSIRTWYKDMKAGPKRKDIGKNTKDDDLEGVVFSDIEQDSEDEDHILGIQNVIDRVEQIVPASLAEEQSLNALRYASTAVSIEDDRIIDAMPDLTEEALEEVISDEMTHIAQVLADSLPAPIYQELPSNPFTNFIFDADIVDFTPLISLRREHQTRQAASGIRQFKNRVISTESVPTEPSHISAAPSEQTAAERQRIRHELAAILDRHNEVAIGTGLPRAVRWGTRSAKINESDITATNNPEPNDGPRLTGNSANAAAAASTNASSLLKYRGDVFKKHGLLPVLETAGITRINEVAASMENRATGYGFVLINQDIMLAKVLSMYSKSPGKGAKHILKHTADKVTAVSYFALQIYQKMANSAFRQVHGGHPLSVKHFAHIPSTSFLCLLETPPSVTSQSIRLAPGSWETFKALKAQLGGIVVAVREISARRRRKAKDDHLDDEDNE